MYHYPSLASAGIYASDTCPSGFFLDIRQLCRIRFRHEILRCRLQWHGKPCRFHRFVQALAATRKRFWSSDFAAGGMLLWQTVRTASVEAVQGSRPVTLPAQLQPLGISYFKGIWELVLKSIYATGLLTTYWSWPLPPYVPHWILLRYLPRPPGRSDRLNI